MNKIFNLDMRVLPKEHREKYKNYISIELSTIANIQN